MATPSTPSSIQPATAQPAPSAYSQSKAAVTQFVGEAAKDAAPLIGQAADTLKQGSELPVVQPIVSIIDTNAPRLIRTTDDFIVWHDRTLYNLGQSVDSRSQDPDLIAAFKRTDRYKELMDKRISQTMPNGDQKILDGISQDVIYEMTIEAAKRLDKMGSSLNTASFLHDEATMKAAAESKVNEDYFPPFVFGINTYLRYTLSQDINPTEARVLADLVDGKIEESLKFVKADAATVLSKLPPNLTEEEKLAHLVKTSDDASVKKAGAEAKAAIEAAEKVRAAEAAEANLKERLGDIGRILTTDTIKGQAQLWNQNSGDDVAAITQLAAKLEKEFPGIEDAIGTLNPNHTKKDVTALDAAIKSAYAEKTGQEAFGEVTPKERETVLGALKRVVDVDDTKLTPPTTPASAATEAKVRN